MASVLQALFALPAFQSRYFASSTSTTTNHATTCPEPLPASCVECQLRKVADGLLSGRYSKPADHHLFAPKDTNPLAHDSPTPTFQEGIKPSGFKALVGKGHEEFATMRQQDSEEFLGHLISVIRRDAQKYKERKDAGGACSFRLPFFVSIR